MRGTADTFAPHAHGAPSALVLLSGSLALTLGGETLPVQREQAVLLDAGQTHAAHAVDYSFVSVEIAPELLDELVAGAGLAFSGARATFPTSVVHDASMVLLAEAISRELVEERPARDAMLDALVRQLGIHLLREHLTVRRAPHLELSRAGLVDRRIRLAVEMMHDNFGRDLTLEEIAGAAYLSPFHFSRLFKQLTGMTVGEYLENLRLERARQLLIHTALPIGEIASTVGYRSQSHFAHVFRQVTGLSPRAFRESARRASTASPR